MKWIRVTRANPCAVCHKPDFCTFCLDLNLVLCMRIASDRPSKNSMGGWLHRTGDPVPVKEWKMERKEDETPKINATLLMRDFSNGTKRDQVSHLAAMLQVTAASILALGAAWAEPHHAWAFPMRDGWGNVVGIRLRAESGKKWAVTGSKQGIFLADVEPQHTAFVVEGPTDEAAALSLGLFAVGRPSCACGDEQIVVAFKRLGVRRAVICTDNDGPGLRGAEKLSQALRIPTAVYIPPGKDLREAVGLGLTRESIESSVNNAVWKCE